MKKVFVSMALAVLALGSQAQVLKNDLLKGYGVLWGIPPCCKLFRLRAYSCAPHLLQNSASSETGAPHCGQVLRAGWAGCSGAASSSSTGAS